MRKGSPARLGAAAGVEVEALADDTAAHSQGDDIAVLGAVVPRSCC